jgi:hypothetical protein
MLQMIMKENRLHRRLKNEPKRSQPVLSVVEGSVVGKVEFCF